MKKINKRIHWEKKEGSQKAAIQYCKKEGNWKEAGLQKTQGRRSDLKDAYNIIRTQPLRKVFENEPNCQVIRSCQMYLSALEEPRTWKTEVYWIYGASGSGKSRLIYELAQSDAYWKDDTKWWDGYDKHHTVVWDDFRGHCCHLTYLLKILDRYPLRVEQRAVTDNFLRREYS